jgi:hypothetical protein
MKMKLKKVFMFVENETGFVKSVFAVIDAIEQKRFVDDKIEIFVGKGISFFLAELDDARNPAFCGLLTRNIYSNKGVLWLPKTDSNSVGNQVDPQFIQELKASTIAYCTLLSCGWQETDESWPKEHFNLKSDTLQTINSKVEIKGPSDSILKVLAEKYNLENRIHVLGCISQNYICGEKKDIAHFLNIFKSESSQDATYKLLQLAKLDVECTFNSLPKEIMDLLLKAYFSSTYTKEICGGREEIQDLDIELNSLNW